mmetsp:Transcript_8097/g.9444  ORF Transcript_8097/g.9444 Transcript_8097/m.9444 type:complete len:181 (-) Transcript_8097:268-810(-)
MSPSSVHVFLLFALYWKQICASSPFPMCPGSPAEKHAKCAMTVEFPHASCEDVNAEIVARMLRVDGWQDPHNQGTYSLLNYSSGLGKIEGSRITGDELYTDLFVFELIESGQGCQLHACSESQVRSVVDYSTNYCNLRSLYCNQSDSCPIITLNLEYEEVYVDCGQRTVEKCISTRENET